MSTQPYQINIEDDSIVVRLPRKSTNLDRVTRFLDYLLLCEVGDRSQLQPEDAVTLANEIDDRAWHEMKDKFLQK